MSIYKSHACVLHDRDMHSKVSLTTVCVCVYRAECILTLHTHLTCIYSYIAPSDTHERSVMYHVTTTQHYQLTVHKPRGIFISTYLFKLLVDSVT